MCYTTEQFARVVSGEIQPDGILSLLDAPKIIIYEGLEIASLTEVDNSLRKLKLVACRNMLMDYEEELSIGLCQVSRRHRVSRCLKARPDLEAIPERSYGVYQNPETIKEEEKDESSAKSGSDPYMCEQKDKSGPDMCEEKDEMFAELGSDEGMERDEVSAELGILLAERNRRAVTGAIEEIKWEIGNPHELCNTPFEDIHTKAGWT